MEMVSVILLIILTAEVILADVSVLDINKLVSKFCVVSVFDHGLIHNQNFVVNLERTNQIKLLTINKSVLTATESNIEVKNKKVDHGYSLSDKKWPFVVFEKRIPDRTCLLKPSSLHTVLKFTPYEGPYNNESFVDFINSHCETYFKYDGSISSEGLHRNDILQNLFHVDHSVNMRSLVDQCGDNLSQFFYSGHCDGQDKQSYSCKTKRDNLETCEKSEKVNILPLPRCETRNGFPSHEDFVENYLFKSKPVIFKNVAKDWPAYTKWSNDYLRKRTGTQNLHIKLTPPVGQFEGIELMSHWKVDDFNIPTEVRKELLYDDIVMVRPAEADMSINEFINLIEKKYKNSSAMSAYLEYTSLNSAFDGLMSDVIEPEIVKNHLVRQHLNIWLSDGNTLGKLHFDQFDNFLAQIRGVKQLILFEPSSNDALYESHIIEAKLNYNPINERFERNKLMQSTSMTMSPFDIARPDFEKFPKSANVFPLNCTIYPGDILFMPSFWWHEVQSYPDPIESRNLAVNYWYDPFLVRQFPCLTCQLDVNKNYRFML